MKVQTEIICIVDAPSEKAGEAKAEPAHQKRFFFLRGSKCPSRAKGSSFLKTALTFLRPTCSGTWGSWQKNKKQKTHPAPHAWGLHPRHNGCVDGAAPSVDCRPGPKVPFVTCTRSGGARPRVPATLAFVQRRTRGPARHRVHVHGHRPAGTESTPPRPGRRLIPRGSRALRPVRPSGPSGMGTYVMGLGDTPSTSPEQSEVENRNQLPYPHPAGRSPDPAPRKTTPSLGLARARAPIPPHAAPPPAPRTLTPASPRPGPLAPRDPTRAPAGTLPTPAPWPPRSAHAAPRRAPPRPARTDPRLCYGAKLGRGSPSLPLLGFQGQPVTSAPHDGDGGRAGPPPARPPRCPATSGRAPRAGRWRLRLAPRRPQRQK